MLEEQLSTIGTVSKIHDISWRNISKSILVNLSFMHHWPSACLVACTHPFNERWCQVVGRLQGARFKIPRTIKLVHCCIDRCLLRQRPLRQCCRFDSICPISNSPPLWTRLHLHLINFMPKGRRALVRLSLSFLVAKYPPFYIWKFEWVRF